MKRLFTCAMLVAMLSAQDSIPSWRFVYSKIYHQLFVASNVDFDYELLKRQTVEFRSLTDQHFDVALDLITYYTGIPWPKNYHLDIYLTRNDFSFSHPMTIAYHPNAGYMLYTLIHESVHHNLNLPFHTSDMEEAICDVLATRIIRAIHKPFEGVPRYSRYYPIQRFYPIELDSTTLKDWWTANKANLDNAYALYQRITGRIRHAGEDLTTAEQQELDRLGMREFSEKTYWEAIQARSDAKPKAALSLIDAYLHRFPDGAYANGIRFLKSEIYYQLNQPDSATTILNRLKRPRSGVNNYLDDAYVRLGERAESNQDLISAYQNYRYVIASLPRGSVRSEAFRNLARIFKREGKTDLAAELYFMAVKNNRNTARKALFLKEMKSVVKKVHERRYKEALLSILQQKLKSETRRTLERYVKELLQP